MGLKETCCNLKLPLHDTGHFKYHPPPRKNNLVRHLHSIYTFQVESTSTNTSDGQGHQQDTRRLLNEMRAPYPLSDKQKGLNADIDYIEGKFHLFVDFVKILSQKIELMKNEHCSTSQTVKNWNSFYSSYHTFMQSPEYNALCKSLFQSRNVNYLLCGSIATAQNIL